MAKEPSDSLTSALALYRKREEGDLLEGTLLRPDKNIPGDPAKKVPGNVIIVVSSNEFYSVPEADILDQEDAPAGYPQRVWVTRGKQVWHCQLTPLNVPGVAPVTDKNFSFHFDQNVISHPVLSQLSTMLPAAPAAAPALECGSVQHDSTKPKDRVTIAKWILHEFQRDDLDPTDESRPISGFVTTTDPFNIALRCETHIDKFAKDKLSIMPLYVHSKVKKLKDLIDCIECCYKHPRAEGQP